MKPNSSVTEQKPGVYTKIKERRNTESNHAVIAGFGAIVSKTNVESDAMDFCRLVLFMSTLSLMAIGISTASGQTRDASRTAVDVVHVKNQKPVRGLILGENAVDGIAIAVSKKWLEKEAPETFATAVLSAENAAIKARLQFRDRLMNLENVKSGALGFLIQKELERIDVEIEDPLREEYQFLILRAKSTSATARNIANDANRKIAIWSWFERLTDVENRKPSILASELKSKNVDTSSTPPSIADRFYPVAESEEHWTTRLAIVSHRLDRSVEFQGTGDDMFPVGGEHRPDVASLMGQIMRSQMNALLQELASGPSKSVPLKSDEAPWTKNAISHAEKIDAGYFRATHVRMDAQSGSATVESRFMVKHAGDSWTTTWWSVASQNAADQKQDSIQRIKEDPQLKIIQTQFESIAGISNILEDAIRMGAATLVAQRIVNGEFQRFSDGYLKRLNSPPIPTIGK